MTLNVQQEIEEIREEIKRIEAVYKARQYRIDPRFWAQDKLGITLWSKQVEILESLRDNRKTAVRSCHEAGKSFTAAMAVAWWLDTHPPGTAFVVTSAPTGRQVKAILWREIGKAHARGGLPGRVNQKEWYMKMPLGNEELVAFGQKPGDLDPTSFQGIHARFVLVIFDEACGMPHLLWTASDSLIANDDGRRLDIGNPDDPTTEFAEVCKPGSGWNTIGISAFDTPNFTGESVPDEVRQSLLGRTWVEERRRKWATDWVWSEDGTFVYPPDGVSADASDPEWQSKVLGVFPSKGGPLSLIRDHWIEAAQERTLSRMAPFEFGVDVGAGGDSSTIAFRQGPVVRVIHEDKNPDTMQTLGNIQAHIQRVMKESGASSLRVKVDKIGIGLGIVDRAIELKKEIKKDRSGVEWIGVNVGLPAKNNEQFANARAENWWGIRERFEAGDIDIDPRDELLASELSSLRYFRTSRGQIQIESKQDAKKRGVASPNRADALMLALSPEPEPQVVRRSGLVW